MQPGAKQANSRRSGKRVVLTCFLAAWLTNTQAPAQDAPSLPASPPPAEELRLTTSVFRDGLKKRGLTELLEHHLQRFPPASETASMLLLRDLRLTEFADATRSKKHRQAAVAEANRLLERIIEKNPDDPRRFEWRFALGHSLIYDEAEPFATNILYRNGSVSDRAELTARTHQAVAALKTLEADLAHEYDRLDGLPVPEFEKLESTGYVERLDDLSPRAAYLTLWALFYDALPRDGGDPARARELMDVLKRISRDQRLLTAPHETSHVQVQALLLGGMTLRRLNRFREARGLFDRAILVGSRIDDPAEGHRVQWAITLAWMERVRSDADEGRFDDAASGLKRFRAMIASDLRNDFGLRAVASLLERSVLRRRAAVTEQKGKTGDARKFRKAAWEALARLARDVPNRRDDINAIVYQSIDRGADPDALDPFEQSALIAGLLSDAARNPDGAETLLARAVDVGRRFLDRSAIDAPRLVPDVLFNTAVAEYRRGRPGKAAALFLRVAREFPGFTGAARASVYAVQIAAERYGDAALRERPEVPRLYRDAIETLIKNNNDKKAVAYWRFYYAQLLEESNEFDAAAAQYAMVDESHEHHTRAAFSRAQCLSLALQFVAQDEHTDRTEIGRRLDAFFAARRSFDALARKEMDAGTDAPRAGALNRLRASLQVITADVQLLPPVNQAAGAIQTLATFETDFPDARDMTGRVWRVRLAADERLGRLDEAKDAIPQYVTADPQNAGPTLQSLYLAFSAEARRQRQRGKNREAKSKAEMALVLADQLQEWLLRGAEASQSFDPYEVAVQLADANLHAQRYARAKALFERLAHAGKEGSNRGAAADDLRVTVGYAESLYQLGEYARALPEFNRLATTLPEGDPQRWPSLLRDLQCRTALNHPPDGIIKVIEQRKFLQPDLGGPRYAAQFEKLERENERRRDARP